MAQTLGHVALLVRDYEEAIAFFTKTLGFRLVEDTVVGEGKRWVLVSPPDSRGASLLLAKGFNTGAGQPHREPGRRARWFLFLHTDDFWRDYAQMNSRGIRFTGPPREETYGTVAVFEDLYGNQWDLLQLKGGSVAK